jgi:hypothetical protein
MSKALPVIANKIYIMIAIESFTSDLPTPVSIRLPGTSMIISVIETNTAVFEAIMNSLTTVNSLSFMSGLRWNVFKRYNEALYIAYQV